MGEPAGLRWVGTWTTAPVAVEGISLTIAALREREFDLAIIPKTWNSTNLHALKPGDPVNLEVDIIAKYVERLLSDRER